jgi:VCBS repeat-containing protein
VDYWVEGGTAGLRTTRADGSYDPLPTSGGAIRVFATSDSIDVSTGEKFTASLTLSAPYSSGAPQVVNPITTLIQSLMEVDQGGGTKLTAAQASLLVSKSFGINTSVDLLRVDPIALYGASTGDTQAAALAMQKVAAQIANLMITGTQAVLAQDSSVDTADASKAILSSLTLEVNTGGGNAIVSLSDITTLDSLLSSVTVKGVTVNTTSVAREAIASANSQTVARMQDLYLLQKEVQGNTEYSDAAFAALAKSVESAAKGQVSLAMSFADSNDGGFLSGKLSSVVDDPKIKIDLTSIKAHSFDATKDVLVVTTYNGDAAPAYFIVSLTSDDFKAGFKTVSLSTVSSGLNIQNLDALIMKAEFGPLATPLGAGYLAFTKNTTSISGSGESAGLITESNAAQTTSGQLPVSIDASAVTYEASTQAGKYGKLVLQNSGAWKYTMEGAHNELMSGQIEADTFNVTATDATGNLVSKIVTVKLQGTNDAAVITGPTAQTITESDKAETVTGQKLTATDVDSSAAFVVQQNISGTKGYGKFSLTAEGAWTYVMDTPHDEFKFGTSYTDSFVATTIDGTKQTITVKINGAAETIAGVASADLTESDAIESADGKLTAGASVIFNASTKVGTNGYGNFNIQSDGTWTYTLNNAHNEFVFGKGYTDFVTVSTTDGTTQTLSVSIVGTNDAAVITGTHSTALTQGISALTTGGKLSVTDVDSSAAFTPLANAVGAGGYGKFSLDALGNWTYTMDSAHKEFVKDQTYVDSITVSTSDGTPKLLTVTMTGTNDAAVFSGDKSGTLTEANAVLTTAGTLLAADSDSSSAFVAQASIAGLYGTFTLATSGRWTYTLNESYDSLSAGQIRTDSFTAKTEDQSTQVVTVTLTGTNDAALIAGSSTASLTESNSVQTVGGTLTVTDIDSSPSFVAQTAVNGTNGYGKWTVNPDGVWSYTLNNAKNEFVEGTKYTDSFSVSSSDGTTKELTVTITGTNDAAVISGTSIANLTESNAVQSTTGNLTISDADSSATFIEQKGVAGSNGFGEFSITSAGQWTYTMSTAHNEFVAGTAYTDSFNAISSDGTTKLVTVSILGTNDDATITGANASKLTESDVAQTTSGRLLAADVDGGEAFVSQTNTSGLYGKFTLGTDGSWSYTMADMSNALSKDNAQNAFKSDTSYVDVFRAVTADGAYKDVTISILGTNDAASISGSLTGSITDLGVVASTTGTLSISDVDSAAIFQTQTAASGSNGYGTFTLTNAGVWTYSMSAQSFDPGENHTDSFTAFSADGTAQVVTVTIKTPGKSSALLTESDVAQTATGNLAAGDYAVQTQIAGSNGFGTFTLNASGAWTYVMNSAHNEFKLQALPYEDSFVAVTANGADRTTVTVLITGTNDAAQISGTAKAALTEGDAVLTASGVLTVSDVDSSETFVAQTAINGSNGHGQFTINSAGAWTYTLNNAHNEFVEGINYTDSFTVTTADGTPQVVTVTISGTNDASVISGNTSLSLTEGSVLTLNNDVLQTISGSISMTDVDSPFGFVPQTGVLGAGGYGSFTVDADGGWSYTMGTAHNEFEDGKTYSDTLTIKTVDGTSQILTVNILGTNDAALISGTSTANLTESNAVQSASGTLLVTDIDSANGFIAQTDVAGNHGFGKFSVNTAGQWTYRMDTAHDEFVGGLTYTDSFTVSSSDGTEKAVTVTITGTNDLANLGPAVVTVDETNTAVSTAGTLVINDAEGLKTFVAQNNVSGTYGKFTLETDGDWTYTANSAYNNLKVGSSLTDVFAVTATEGATSSVTVHISGTNDDPEMSQPISSYAVAGSGQNYSLTLIQGTAAQTIATAVGTDVDAVGSLTYSLSPRNGDASAQYFSINASGAIKFLAPAALSSTVDAKDDNKDGLMDSPYVIHVVATDVYGGTSLAQAITVNIKMAVSIDGKSAELPGTSADWQFAPQAKLIEDSPVSDGFKLINSADSNIYLNLPSSVDTLNFRDGTQLTQFKLSNNGTVGTIEDLNVGNHKISVAQDVTEYTHIAVKASGVQSISGATDSAIDPFDPDSGPKYYRSDTLEIQNTQFSNTKFLMVSGELQLSVTGGGTKTLTDIENVVFADRTVHIIGANGYATFKEAIEQGQFTEGDYVYGSKDSNIIPTQVDLNSSHLTAVSGLTDFYTYNG